MAPIVCQLAESGAPDQYYNDLQHSITTANNEKQVLNRQFFGNIFIN